MHVVGPRRREDVEVHHRLVAGRLDVVLDTSGDVHDRAGTDLVVDVADVVDRGTGDDHRDLVEVVRVRSHLHAGPALVHDEHHAGRAEAAPPDAGTHLFIRDVLPVDRLHGVLLSGSTKPSSVDRFSAASHSSEAISPSLSTDDVVPTSAIVATISAPWKTGAASAAMPSTTAE